MCIYIRFYLESNDDCVHKFKSAEWVLLIKWILLSPNDKATFHLFIFIYVCYCYCRTFNRMYINSNRLSYTVWMQILCVLRHIYIYLCITSTCDNCDRKSPNREFQLITIRKEKKTMTRWYIGTTKWGTECTVSRTQLLESTQ